MPREYEIGDAFSNAIQLDARGRRIVTTNNFRLELEKVNHVWPLEECNRWIKRYQTFFLELVTDGGENKTWALRNMGYVR
ncbi:hypothetical protein [Atlantibacter hermannii]|uniref:hypothetical protein n=1 Tax=Atlantibacter hermannii TaxID=565 RepID=UPI0028A21D94|nr:hypothetical protein [Atlantibacter hermannii]